MTIFPLQAFLAPLADNPWTYVVFGLIGFGFGFVLELSGFGNSKKLAAQFYFKDLAVLKVMFTAIITAMLLLTLSSAIGILDFNLVYVDETYLWPGILGGVIMGVGFIVGGFCPGTSVVSASTLKIDGVVFLVGALTGMFAFGETEQYFDGFWHSSYYGRLTLMDVFHLPMGVVALLVVLMALFMFWGGEKLEVLIGKRDLSREPRMRYVGAGTLISIAIVCVILGQPGTAEKWARVATAKDALLNAGKVQIEPAELTATKADDKLNVVLLDVRSESDYNLFHLAGARRVPLDQLEAMVPSLLSTASSSTVTIVMSNDEGLASQAWKVLEAQSVPNVYILKGGINSWIRVYGEADPQIVALPSGLAEERLAFSFPAALGSQYVSANPDPLLWKLPFIPKIQLQRQRSISGGGCG